MSYSADYIKRMIEQMGAFLLALRDKLDEDKPNEVLTDVQESYRQLFGVDGEFLLNAPENYLALMTGIGRVGDSDKTISLADLLTIEGEAYALKGMYEESVRRYSKALNVLIDTFLTLGYAKSADHTERIAHLVSLTADETMPSETLLRLFRYSERIGEFAQAEDILYELLESALTDVAYDDLADEGVAFYERLQGLDDVTLVAGGLPRDEVEDGLHELLNPN